MDPGMRNVRQGSDRFHREKDHYQTVSECEVNSICRSRPDASQTVNRRKMVWIRPMPHPQGNSNDHDGIQS